MSTTRQKQRTLVALMLPQLTVVLNLAMVNVALPAIRETFDAPADVMAWVITIYMLPYVAMMPLYGRLGDDLGIRRMMFLGMGVFLVGTAVNALSQSLPLLLAGRFIQGLGASGMSPLAIAMITRIFSVKARGQALGQWNSVGPVAGLIGSLLGGLVIDTLGWRFTFFLPILAGGFAVGMVYRAVQSPGHPLRLGGLRSFDWLGVILLSATLAFLLFYVTSRPITGRQPFTDWRLLLVALVLLAGFLWHERRKDVPFIDLSLLKDSTYLKVCIAAALRMFVMSGISFLTPLYLADVKERSATVIGIISMIRSAGLFPTMYFGGQVADRWGSRLPMVLGLSVQAASVVLLIVSGPGPGVALVVVGLVLNGLGAGVVLPALHRGAMSGSDGARGGTAAGLYSMIRFWGMMLGTAVVGVLLQVLLDRGTTALVSYRLAFASTVVVGAVGVVTAISMRKPGA
jgi:MFS family permease